MISILVIFLLLFEAPDGLVCQEQHYDDVKQDKQKEI